MYYEETTTDRADHNIQSTSCCHSTAAGMRTSMWLRSSTGGQRIPSSDKLSSNSNSTFGVGTTTTTTANQWGRRFQQFTTVAAVAIAAVKFKPVAASDHVVAVVGVVGIVSVGIAGAFVGGTRQIGRLVFATRKLGHGTIGILTRRRS
jgi:L-cystine uptake protein TcyP (sodium:dicarboxylate symporter family)